MRRAKPLHDLDHVERSDRMLVLIQLPSPLGIADINVDINRPILGAHESGFRSGDLLFREGEGDDDEGPEGADVEGDGSPTR